MKIGFDAKRAFFNARGLGQYSRNLIQGVNDYYPQNDYYLYTPVFQVKEQLWIKKYPKMQIRQPKNFLLQKFSSLWRSYFLYQDLKQDKIHLFHGLSHELPFGIEKLNIKKIVTIHDLLFIHYPYNFPFVDRFFYHRKYNYSIKVADLIIAISEQTKKDILEYYSVSEEKIRVIYQSCHERFYTLLSNEDLSLIKKKYALPENYILYVGAIEKNKNLLFLIKAFEVSHSREKGLHLVLVGRGKLYRDQIKDEVRKMNMENEVYFFENVLDDDLPGIYQNSCFFVYPSFYEGLGIPIVEALFSGRPVITSHSSGMLEAAGPGAKYINPKNIIELKEAIDGLYENASLRQDLAKKGKEYVQKFHRKYYMESLMEAYAGLV